jgi:hypothetical protein
MKHVKFDENYCLLTQEVNSNVTVMVTKSVDYVFKIDVSGSMSGELGLIRQQLKNKLPSLTKEGDFITIIWFSGPSEAGILVESVEIKSLKTFETLNAAIDRWLRPVGMTAFKKPYVLMKEVIERIRKQRPDAVFSSIFLSDGGNNSVAWSEVISAMKSVEMDLSASLIVEYGYYADSQRLTEMATILGGEKVSCSSFEDYDLVFEKKLKSSIHGGKKTLVELSSKYLYDFAFSVDNDGSVLLYIITDNKVMVGADVKEIHYFSNKIIGENVIADTPLYAAIYVLSDRLMNDDAEKIFYALGDNYYYKMLANAFGKQKLNDFKLAIKECVADTSKRCPEGKAEIQPVDENTYCFMNLIGDLGSIDGCLFFPNHQDFIYNRIGKKRNAKGSSLSEADKQRLAEAKNVDEATAILEELKEKNVDLKFVNTNPDRGYALTDLVWNEERANLSIRIRIEGKAVLPSNKFGIDEISTYKYNTFTLVKDGIVNVEKLPVSYSLELEKILNDKKVSYVLEYDKVTSVPHTIIISLNSLPIINRSMVKSISADELAKQAWELQKLQADKKVYDYYRKSLFPKESTGFIETLTPSLGAEKAVECAAWLKEIGITDFNGFAPKTETGESTDFYMSVNLATKIKGLSALPKVEDVVAKLKDGKPLKAGDLIMSDAIKKYQAQTESDLYKSLGEEQQKDVLKSYLISKSTESIKLKRKAMQKIAETVFSLILSKKWFKEFKSFDENTIDRTFDGQNLTFVFDLSEKQVDI